MKKSLKSTEKRDTSAAVRVPWIQRDLGHCNLVLPPPPLLLRPSCPPVPCHACTPLSTWPAVAWTGAKVLIGFGFQLEALQHDETPCHAEHAEAGLSNYWKCSITSGRHFDGTGEGGFVRFGGAQLVFGTLLQKQPYFLSKAGMCCATSLRGIFPRAYLFSSWTKCIFDLECPCVPLYPHERLDHDSIGNLVPTFNFGFGSWDPIRRSVPVAK